VNFHSAICWRMLLKLIMAGGVLLTAKKMAGKAAEDIWERISFSVPPGTTKVKVGLSQILVTTSIDIANLNNLKVTIGGLSAILKYRDQNGVLQAVEARQTSGIDNIQVKAGTLGTIKALANALSQPAGSRLLVVFSGTVNGLSLPPYEYWY
jgi:hypothetical protein